MPLYPNGRGSRLRGGPVQVRILPGYQMRMFDCEHCPIEMEEKDVHVLLAEDAKGWNTAIVVCCYCSDDYELLEMTEW